LTAAGERDAFLKLESEFHALAQRLGLSPHDMRQALRLVIDDGWVVASVDPCLTHNDFCAKHLMVANGAISGIIDFGEVAGGEPLSDFVCWDYYDAARFPLAWLQEGYTNKRVFDGTFTQRLSRQCMAFSLWAMQWYDRRGYAEGVADARAKFLRDRTKLSASGCTSAAPDALRAGII
jgi:aminoglycoside phosphotransferase (APT) family kinase protein